MPAGIAAAGLVAVGLSWATATTSDSTDAIELERDEGNRRP